MEPATDTTPPTAPPAPPSEAPTPESSCAPSSSSAPASEEAPASLPRLSGLFGQALAHAKLDPNLEDQPPQRYAANPECPQCHGHGYVTRPGANPGDPDFGKVFPCPCSEAMYREQRIRRLFGRAQFPSEFLEPGKDSFSSFALRPDGDQEARLLVQDWAEQGENGLYLWGTEGVGKTGLAVCALRHRVEVQGVDVLYRYVPELLDDIRAGFDKDLGGMSSTEIAQTIRETGLLLLDDLGKETLTPWVRETFHKLIDYRWREHRPTVFTSNFPLEELKTRMDGPFYSRVRDMVWPNVLQVRGKELRKGA